MSRSKARTICNEFCNERPFCNEFLKEKKTHLKEISAF